MTSPDQPEIEPQAPAVALRQCPNCGRDVAVGGRGLGRSFCNEPCQRKWNARNKARGAVLAPMIMAWMETRHAKPGTEAYEVCRVARLEATDMARIFREQDRDAGRPPVWKHARRQLLEQHSRYQDRCMK